MPDTRVLIGPYVPDGGVVDRTHPANGAGEDAGAVDLIYAIVLLQGAFGLLAALGVAALMGSLVYLVAPVVKFAVMLVVAARIRRRRSWALIVMVIVQTSAMTGFWVSVLIGALPGVTTTINLVGLLTGMALPVVVIVLCVRIMRGTRANVANDGGEAGADLTDTMELPR
jgi:hypothetical protein